MLYPEIKEVKEHSFCTCGAPNFRSANDSKKIYKLYSLEIPTAPYGSKTHILCEDCMKKIIESFDKETRKMK